MLDSRRAAIELTTHSSAPKQLETSRLHAVATTTPSSVRRRIGFH